MFRCSRHSLKFANKGKKENLTLILNEYRRLLQFLVDYHWQESDSFSTKNSLNNFPKYISRELEIKCKDETWLSARMIQCAGKQALYIISSAISKHSKRLYQLGKLQKEGKSFLYLQRKIDNTVLVKPNCSRCNLELDSRFADFEDGKHFNIFARLTCLGNKIKILLPIKKTSTFKKWNKKGVLKTSVRITEDEIFLLFEVPEKQRKKGKTVSIDQGSVTCCTLSDGQITEKCKHGHDLNSIQKRLARKKKGSKSFKRCQSHRKNYIDWSINQLNFKNVKEIKLEKLFQVGKGKHVNRFLQAWTYTLINDKIKSTCENEGIKLTEVPNQFRSQRCFACSYVHKKSRKGKQFCCQNCQHVDDADNNACQNLLLYLYEIPFWVQPSQINRTGFFWKSNGIFDEDNEPIVRCAKR